MKFDISNLHTIYENTSVIKEEANQNTIKNLFEDIQPISTQIYESLRENMANPKNLNLTYVQEEYSEEDPKLYIEAVEFAMFCEATGLTIGEAADEIINSYSEEVPELNNAEFHVIFPEDSLNKNVLGGENLGKRTADDWATKLFTGCRRYGLKVNAGVGNKLFDEGCCDK